MGADGRVTTVELLPTSRFPEPLVALITAALQRNALFLPAIERGTAVAGQHDFTLKIPAADPKLAADTAWLNGELVNDSWVERTSRLDDVVVPLRLKQGKNHFLIKIQNVKGHWSFTCRLRVRGG